MHLENLKIFIDLVESQNFSRTARLNDVTQSAVSQQIRTMEKHFNINIVDRSQKSFRLTQEGDKLYARAKEMLYLYDSLTAELQSMKDSVNGTIHISTIYSIGLHELPPYIKIFLKKYPDVNIRIEYRRSNLVYEDIQHNISDIGLVAYPINNRTIDTLPFLEDKLVAICSPEHALAKQKSVKLADIHAHPVVGFEKDIPTRKAIDKIFKKSNLELNHVMEFDNVETVKRAVEINAGISLVPSATVRQEVQQGTLIQLNIQNADIIRPLAIIHRKGRILTPAMRKFIELLQKESVSNS